MLTQTLTTVTQFINNFSGYISNTTACIQQDPLCEFCLNDDTCKLCREVREHYTRISGNLMHPCLKTSVI